jgi:pyruvate/2-oxoglutarate dehydrogenase complex dihydrolipoamide dehydrogenase (E3) component
MEEKKFNEAKATKEMIDKLHTRVLKLQEAIAGTMNRVTVEYVSGEGRFSRPGEIYLNNAADIRDLMQKEYEEIQLELVKLREKFKSL